MTHFELYVKRYLDKIPVGKELEWINYFDESENETIKIFKNLPKEFLKIPYAEGKWNLQELLCHLIDTERIFQFRALSFARGETENLPGFDEEKYAKNSFANRHQIENLVEEFKIVRKSSKILFHHFNKEVFENKGIANGNEISVETIGKLIIGHNYHHLEVIKEKYIAYFKINN